MKTRRQWFRLVMGVSAIAGCFVFSSSDQKFWLIKTDTLGNAEWNKTYGTGGIDQCLGMIQTLDGGYLLTGQEWTGPNEGGIAVKTDSAGNIEWNRTYIDTFTKLYKAIQTEDGGYALAGEWLRDVVGQQALLLKTDANGIMQWYKSYGGEGEEYFSSMARTADGGYALAGWTSSIGAGSYDFWLVKTDDNGVVQFSKTYGGSSEEVARSIVRTSDGGYALGGLTTSFGAGSYDFWLVKTDTNGNMEWNRTYGGPGVEAIWSLVQTTDGGYALAGSTNSFGSGGYDFWLVKTDVSGVVPEFSAPVVIFLLVGTGLSIFILKYRPRRYPMAN